MAFSEYWASLRLKNPSLSDDSTKMTISVESFKKQLQKAHFDGWQEGWKRGSKTNGDNPFGDLGKLFGM